MNTVHTVRIDTMKKLMEIVYDQPLDKGNGRYRGYYLYRGLPDASFELKTSLQRNCKDKSSVLEQKLLSNFAKYTAIEDAEDSVSVWRRMILGQHHGLPTRLLDWTHSPFVALNFATLDYRSKNYDSTDCVLWRIDANKIHDRLPEEFKEEMQRENARIFSVDMLNNVAKSVEEYDEITNNNAMVILEPPSLDPRIVNQYAFFSVIPGEMKDIEKYFCDNFDDSVVCKYVIDGKLKWRIRDFLDEANISERTIYPGIDGICNWLARHYYVRE